MTAALLNYWLGVPSFIIGIPAMLVPIFVWCYFVDRRKV